ncbi:heavy metal sensor histidine kinase [Vogesella indigofera]|uniref:heavy metal sensor histidine kinase n=1 Tax=Vogesella indigofera TaxID=45465 RepID=UPI00234F901F|nr:heavy metal sensor histidine kinase [Vogesella indigofera]MDC7710745.1 heavy metal sensor histidine kinase [Vogesella indigofera]
MRQRFSLTARLTLLYALVSVLLLAGLGVLVGVMMNRHFAEQDADDLRDKLGLIREVMSTSPDIATLAERLDDVVHNHRDLYVQLQRLGYPVYASRSPAAFHFPAVDAAANRQMVSWQHAGANYHGMCRSGRLADGGRTELTICAAIDTGRHEHFMQMIGRSLAVYILLSALLGGVLAWWVAHNGLAPLRAMKARAQAITGQQLDTQMPVASVPPEMADLAESLNAMLRRLQQDFRKLSEFSSDLAHELRTPISNLLTETQVAIAQPRSADEYRDILASNAEEFQRLARTVSDMLFLAKAEHGLVLPSREQIAIEDEVAALLEFYDALAEEKAIRLQQTGHGRMLGDRLMLRRALSNLLSNALRHTPAGGVVSISLQQDGNMTAVSICNPGPAIPAEQQPRLFDRFYRADPARVAGESDGAGLGLAITRSIVEVHGGSISVTSADDATCFTLRFPAQPPLAG